MEEPKRYNCGNGEGMFDDKKGYWISYKEHQEIVNKLKEAIAVTPCCKSDSEQLFAVLRYTMPDHFTDLALRNIVKGFEEISK